MQTFTRKFYLLYVGEYFKWQGQTWVVTADTLVEDECGEAKTIRSGEYAIIRGDTDVVPVSAAPGSDPEKLWFFNHEEEASYIHNLIEMTRRGSKTAEESLRDFCGA